jgi:hypothetical protein
LKITFIKPNIGRREHSLYIDHGRMEPLMLAVLAGMTPPDVDVVLHDDRMEAIPYDEPTDLVAISVESYTARRSYEIAAEYRERGVQVILGGMHPTLIPDEAARHADSIFLGDAELIWLIQLTRMGMRAWHSSLSALRSEAMLSSTKNSRRRSCASISRRTSSMRRM